MSCSNAAWFVNGSAMPSVSWLDGGRGPTTGRLSIPTAACPASSWVPPVHALGSGEPRAPLAHAWLLHATAGPHCPSVPHVSTPLLFGSQRVASGAHTPMQAPPTQAWLTQAAAVPHAPSEVHVSTPLLFGSHFVVPGAQTRMIAPHTLGSSTEQPLLQALAFLPAVQYSVQELALSHAVQFVVQALAFLPAVQYSVQALALRPQLQLCVQLLQLPVQTQSPVQPLQSPVITVALVTAALLVSSASLDDGAELHAIVRQAKRTGTADLRKFLFRPKAAVSAPTKARHIAPRASPRSIRRSLVTRARRLRVRWREVY